MKKHIHLVYRSVSDQKPESILGDFKRLTSKPIELWSNKVIDEKINYIHNNPVEQGLVFRPEDYIYSSAIDYSGEKGILDDVVIK